MKSKSVTFKFDSRSLTTLENMAIGDGSGEFYEITITDPETGEQDIVLVPKLASPKKCPYCGNYF